MKSDLRITPEELQEIGRKISTNNGGNACCEDLLAKLKRGEVIVCYYDGMINHITSIIGSAEELEELDILYRRKVFTSRAFYAVSKGKLIKGQKQEADAQ